MAALTETEREEFLADTHVAVLSVAATGGRPPASVPIWYSYEPGGNILIGTAVAARKTKLVEQSGVVTVVVQREEPPYKYVVVEGTVIDTAVPAPANVMEATAIRYLGEEAGRAFSESMADRPGVLFTIRPDRWITADFSDEL